MSVAPAASMDTACRCPKNNIVFRTSTENGPCLTPLKQRRCGPSSGPVAVGLFPNATLLDWAAATQLTKPCSVLRGEARFVARSAASTTTLYSAHCWTRTWARTPIRWLMRSPASSAGASSRVAQRRRTSSACPRRFRLVSSTCAMDRSGHTGSATLPNSKAGTSVNLDILVQEVVLPPQAAPWFAQIVKSVVHQSPVRARVTRSAIESSPHESDRQDTR